MFIYKDASLIIDVLKKTLPSEIVDDPGIIIAGGAALSFYLLNELLLSVDNSILSMISRSINPSMIVKFSDIDLWKIKGQETVLDDFFNENFDVKPKKSEIEIKLDTIDQELNGLVASLAKNQKTYNKISLYENNIYVNLIKKFNLKEKLSFSLSFVNSSRWTNTFAINEKFMTDSGNSVFPNKVIAEWKYKKQIQCMVAHQDSAESLISEFDLCNCAIAINNGKFIIHEKFLESLKNKEVSFLKKDDNFDKRTLASRLYLSLRYLKYYEKTGFDLSKEIYDVIIQTCVAASSFLNEKDKEKVLALDKTKLLNTKVKSYDIDNETISESTEPLAITLSREFLKLKNMKHYTPASFLFIPESKQFKISSVINDEFLKIDSQKNENLNKENKLEIPVNSIQF